MAPLTGDLVASDINLSVYNDSSAHACPENHTEDDAGFRSRTINGLRKCEAIRVILHAYRPPQPGLKVAVEGLAIQDSAVRILKQSSGGRDRPRGGNAHCTGLSCLSFRERDQLGYSVQDAWVVSDGRGDTVPQKRGTSTGGGIGKRNGLDLGAAQINSYSHSRLHALAELHSLN